MALMPELTQPGCRLRRSRRQHGPDKKQDRGENQPCHELHGNQERIKHPAPAVRGRSRAASAVLHGAGNSSVWIVVISRYHLYSLLFFKVPIAIYTKKIYSSNSAIYH